MFHLLSVSQFFRISSKTMLTLSSNECVQVLELTRAIARGCYPREREQDCPLVKLFGCLENIQLHKQVHFLLP